MGGSKRSGSADGFRNVLSFDLEHWHSATLLQDELTDAEDRIETSVGTVLEILAEHDTTATFFVVGGIVEEYPTLIERIADAGHEIASHGHTHTPLFELTQASFTEELQASAEAIASVTGQQPLGFRAPNFSVTPRTQWAFDALLETGYRYDSSVFPVKTPMYGVSDAPVHPYWVDRNSPFEDSRPVTADTLLEFPLAIFHPQFRIPVAGGFYGRIFPTWMISRGIRALNRRGIPAMIYFHPWEFNSDVRTGEPSFHKRFISFHNLNHTREVLETLLTSHDFGTCHQLLERYTEETHASNSPDKER